MDFSNSSEDARFREEVSTFFKQFTGDGGSLPTREREQTLGRAMAERGLVGVRLVDGALEPTLDKLQALIVAEEAVRWGVDLNFITGNMFVAKTLAVVGTEDQKLTILPRIARGEVRVALGYTEPDTGSDIAAARTTAIRDGDEWRINGQKMFTSGAAVSDYIWLLTRTSPDKPKWAGLTMFILPTDTPGITVQPLETIDGEREATMTFYDDVRVPDSARVGEVDGGAAVLRLAMDFEHGGGAVPGRSLVGTAHEAWRSAVEQARNVLGADGRPLLDDPMVRERLVTLAIRNDVSALLELWSISTGGSSGPSGAVGSLAKLHSRETQQLVFETILDIFGDAAGLPPGVEGGLADGEFEVGFRRSMVATISGGSSEIQRNIIAERLLGLPRMGRK
jgi:alkylation response protein AidB-like acyl-CoA dehydrogenase